MKTIEKKYKWHIDARSTSLRRLPSFPCSASECRLRRPAPSAPKWVAERPARHSHAMRGNEELSGPARRLKNLALNLFSFPILSHRPSAISHQPSAPSPPPTASPAPPPDQSRPSRRRGRPAVVGPCAAVPPRPPPRGSARGRS